MDYLIIISTAIDVDLKTGGMIAAGLDYDDGSKWVWIWIIKICLKNILK